MTKQDIIKENYINMTVKELSELCNCSTKTIYRYLKQLNLKCKPTKKSQNKTYNINNIQKQIILSGIFGDGNIRISGKGAVYREKHGLEEKEYCKWKYDNLGELTKDKSFYMYKDKYVSFDTYNSKEILNFKNMSNEDIINNLDELGLVLYLLDDGWTRKYKSYMTFCVSSEILDLKTMNLLVEKYKKIFNYEDIYINNTDKDTVIIIKDIRCLLYVFEKYNMENLDVYKKKILKNTTKVAV